jgi:tRNA threonylcarbamoyl adenosine modification protein YeaZ
MNQEDDSQARLLIIDSASPLLSVAVGQPPVPLVELESRSSRSSTALMSLIDDCLGRSEVTLARLCGVVVLSGPGSFTGLRVGMSIALGFHQALGLHAGTISTFIALASQAPDPNEPCLALVRALRGEWFAQRFLPGLIADQGPFRIHDEALSKRTEQIVGFGLDQEPAPLAGPSLALAAHFNWDTASLTRPAYLAPPPTHTRGVPALTGD